jgi:hypothetical protein
VADEEDGAGGGKGGVHVGSDIDSETVAREVLDQSHFTTD